MSNWDIGICSVHVVGAFFRVVATLSSRTALTLLVLYTWAIEFVFKVFAISYQMYLASAAPTRDQCARIIATTFPPMKAMLVHIGGFALNGLGLKAILNEMRDRDEWVSQGRIETIDTLAEKDEKDRSGSMEGDEQGKVDDQDEEKEDIEPHTLLNILGKGWFGLAIAFNGRVVSKLDAYESSQQLFLYVVIDLICVWTLL